MTSPEHTSPRMTHQHTGNPSDELLPCPFCGGEADFGARPNERAWWSLHCGDCTAYRVGQTEAEAITAWNRRSADAALVDALEATLDGLRRASRILSEDCKSALNGKQWGGLLIDNAERVLALTQGERT